MPNQAMHLSREMRRFEMERLSSRRGDRKRSAFQIMKLGNLSLMDIAFIPEVDRSGLTFLWFNDFYDGPLAGMAELNGTRYLFEMIDRNVLGDEEEDRRYWLIALTDEQLENELKWHDLFCNKVGTHFDFTDRAPLPRESVDLDAFYVPYRNRVPPDYSDNHVVGWFRL